MTALSMLLVLLLTPGVPLVLALVLLVRPHSRSLKVLASWSALPGMATSLFVPAGVAATVPWLLQGSEFGLDATGRLFLFFSAAIWLGAGLLARTWPMRGRPRFLFYFLLVMSGNLGLIIARDMLAFYLFFALMSFAAYGMVVHDGSQRARHAGRIYMAFVLAGDMMIFAALTLVALSTGGDLTFETVRRVLPEALHHNLATALLILGFGVKVGVLGLHVTLPPIYVASPVPTGVVLSGAMVNGGLMGWLRMLPVDSGVLPGWGELLVVLGVAAAFYGALAGLLQTRPRAVLAYSSISQLGIVTLGVGVALAVPDHEGKVLAAVTLYALHHAFAKAALFLGSGIVERTATGRSVWVGLGLLLPCLALTGFPLTTGLLAKAALKDILPIAPDAWQGTVGAALPWMAFATTLVLARFLWLVWRQPQGAQSPDRRGMVVWMGLVALSLTAAWMVPGADPGQVWTTSAIWQASWPVLLAAVLSSAACTRTARARLAFLPNLPPGDVLVLMTAGASKLVAGWSALAGGLPAVRDWSVQRGRALILRPVWLRATAALERTLLDWRTAGILFLVMTLLLWLLQL